MDILQRIRNKKQIKILLTETIPTHVYLGHEEYYALVRQLREELLWYEYSSILEKSDGHFEVEGMEVFHVNAQTLLEVF